MSQNSQMRATEETLRHIRRVQALLGQVVKNLIGRQERHDASKLESPEVEAFEEFTHLLRATTYGSEEYERLRAAMKPALDHHYAANSHHPEFYGEKGIRGMSLLDLIEMLVDWRAATERHADGSIERSIEINQKRFGYGDELKAILRNTINELGF